MTYEDNTEHHLFWVVLKIVLNRLFWLVSHFQLLEIAFQHIQNAIKGIIWIENKKKTIMKKNGMCCRTGHKYCKDIVQSKLR